jgi:predicted transcriptional regulator
MYKIIAAALLISSGDALNVGPVSRRAALTKAVGASAALIPLAAFADLKRAGDAELYKRADEGNLNAARAIERAKTGDLADGSSATCSELDALIAVDREAVEFEKEKLVALGGDEKQKKVVADVENKLQSQIDQLKVKRASKGCGSAGANLKQKSDFDVYKRADEGQLTAARVIERAKKGTLVDGSGASCAELEKIIAVDKKAIKFEKDKLDALGSSADPATKKAVAEAEKAIEAQVKKLAALQKSKTC